jgi:small GTP-binding protein
MMGRQIDYSLKVVAVGDSGAGKTSVLLRYVRDSFDEESQSTLGVETLSKIIQTERHRIKLQLWDTAGQELFRSVTRGYYRGSAVALLVFDLTRSDSFDHIGRWLQDVRDVAQSDVVTILMGNKSDLADERQVSAEEAELYANENSMRYFETSAKTGANITEAVEAGAYMIDTNMDDTRSQVSTDQVSQNAFGESVDFEKEDTSKECAC